MDKGAVLAILCIVLCACSAVVSLVCGTALFTSGANPLAGLLGGGGGGGGSGGGGGGSGLVALTQEDGQCGSGKVKNDGGQCVPLTVESPYFGGGDGNFSAGECPDGTYVTGINVGYDDKVQELKYIAAGCSDGQREWVHGKKGPSNLGKSIANALSMGMAGMFIKPDGGYENRLWVNPAKPGWDQVAYVTDWDAPNRDPWHGSKGGSRVRALGPSPILNQAQETGMFGAPDNVSYYAGKHGSGADQTPNDEVRKQLKVWRCDADGAAPSGKRYAIVGINSYTGSAVDRFSAKCRMFDTNAKAK